MHTMAVTSWLTTTTQSKDQTSKPTLQPLAELAQYIKYRGCFA